MITGTEVGERLADPRLPDRLTALGFRPDDAAELAQRVPEVLARPDDRALIATLAKRLTAHLGEFTPVGHPDVWSDAPPDPDGLLPMLTLVVTAPEVATWHRQRDVPADISAASLTDLGQQVWVHRLTYGRLGLHTHDWLTVAWSGALYWLGRLQFNLQPDGDGWVLSTHIPRTGPLVAEAVDESIAVAERFFATHFADHPVHDIICSSWLLDPALAEALPGTNLAAFQRRWELTDQRGSGLADVLFFVFGRRDPVDLADLPRTTALERAVLDRLTSGAGWSTITGRLRR